MTHPCGGQPLQELAIPEGRGVIAVNPSATCANDKRLIILRKYFLSLMQSKVPDCARRASGVRKPCGGREARGHGPCRRSVGWVAAPRTQARR